MQKNDLPILKNNLQDNIICIVGLGYVGLPLAVEFSKVFNVIGYDNNARRIKELNVGEDKTKEISSDRLLNIDNLKFTNQEGDISNADIYIITVPTPVDKNNNPDLNPIKKASSFIGANLNQNNIVIYESTVFPGCTEEICVPILEEKSNLKYNKEFFCGYSPERINPGDRLHTLSKIVKIVSGSNDEVAELVDKLYGLIIEAGTFKASSIAVAEAAKVIENTQRDVNIALINELSMIFHKLGLDTKEVLDAAKTKWNFLPFSPGLVGGHCIGVDPYYLTHRAKEVGFHPEIILAGRKINDKMGSYIVDKVISELARKGLSPVGAKIAIMGLTFKEDCPDLRNTKVISMIDGLEKFNCDVKISDSEASRDSAIESYGVSLCDLEDIKDQDAVIFAVGHKNYKSLKINSIRKILKSDGVLIDVKSIFNKKMFENTGITYWRL